MTIDHPKFRPLVTQIYLQRLLLLIVLVTDVFFMSLVSNEAVAGVGSVVPLIYSIVAILGAFASTSTSLISRSFGENDQEKAKSIFTMALIIGLSLGTFFMLLLIIISPYVGNWMGLSKVASEASRQYLMYMSPMLILDGFFLNFTSYIYANGKPKATIYSSAALAITNLLSNGALAIGWMPGLEMSPKGIAISTLISQFPPIFIMGYVIFKRTGLGITSLLRISKFTFNHGKKIITIGIPASFQPISLNVSQLFIFSFLAKISILALAASTYCKNLVLMFSVAGGTAVGIATQVIIGHLQGKKELEKANNRMLRSISLFIPALVIVIFLLYSFSNTIFGFFTKDQTVLHYCGIILIFMIISEPFKALNYIVLPSLQGSADVKRPMIFAILSHWVLGVFIAWLFGIHFKFGIYGIMMAITLDEGFRAGFNLYRWTSKKWVTYLKK